ncbi:MAG: hypothetical protein DHS20C17_20370 [Cyclobacteriaceae bacterium]|nr:MAG: hypothetical protein DHS20C17_20370 [Cyclobacteriaceae bacterium]
MHNNYSHHWPEIPYHEISATCSTLHLVSQIIGKIRLVQTPWTNHSWHVPLYLTSNGLTTSPIPHSQAIFEINLNFINHHISIEKITGESRIIPLKSQSISEYYQQIMQGLDDLEIPVSIYTTPSEIPDTIPFEKDQQSREYQAVWANKFWSALIQIDSVFKDFRSGFIGKCSPVHFFWGSFDLAVTRFSGREAPAHPGGIPNFPDWVAREAYSHEVSSGGFWPGGSGVEYPLFYSYAYPAPNGFKDAQVLTPGAYYSDQLGEFVLPYEKVLDSDSPYQTLFSFLQETYNIAATTGNWDRGKLEKNFDR